MNRDRHKPQPHTIILLRVSILIYQLPTSQENCISLSTANVKWMVVLGSTMVQFCLTVKLQTNRRTRQCGSQRQLKCRAWKRHKANKQTNMHSPFSFSPSLVPQNAVYKYCNRSTQKGRIGRKTC
jgi:hypothetical protein